MRRKAELSTSTNKPEQTRDRHGFRGVPPPPTFSLTALADDCLLTEFEVAAVLRVSTNSMGGWRRQPNKTDDHRQLHEFDHIDPALAALDAGDRRLRLADTQCNLMQCL